MSGAIRAIGPASRERRKIGPKRVIGREKLFFSMANGRVGISGVIGVSHSAGDEIDRDSVTEGRVRVVEKLRITKKQKLEFVRGELDDIEFGSELMPRGEGVEQLIQFGADIFFAGVAVFA
jgi:hypothetical protein